MTNFSIKKQETINVTKFVYKMPKFLMFCPEKCKRKNFLVQKEEWNQFYDKLCSLFDFHIHSQNERRHKP